MLAKEAHECAGQESKTLSSRRGTCSYASRLGNERVSRDYVDTYMPSFLLIYNMCGRDRCIASSLVTNFSQGRDTSVPTSIYKKRANCEHRKERVML